MINHSNLNMVELKRYIRNGIFSFAGNSTLKIYGKLYCKTGKRMKPENRVFFYSEEQALENGYRPCGHCMPLQYKKWKNGII